MKMNSDSIVKQQYLGIENYLARVEITEKCSRVEGKYGVDLLEQELKGNENILDAGCGFCRQTRKLLENLSESGSVTSIDLSLNMLQYGQDILLKENIKPTLIQADCMNIPLKNDQFDIVLAQSMLYHVPDVDAVIKEFTRVMKEDGKLFATSISFEKNKESEGIRRLERKDLDERFHIEIEPIKFSIENGREILEKFFKKITFHPCEVSMVFEDIEDYMRYYVSLPFYQNIKDHQRERKLVYENVNNYIEGKIEEFGFYEFKYSLGTFICYNVH